MDKIKNETPKPKAQGFRQVVMVLAGLCAAAFIQEICDLAADFDVLEELEVITDCLM